MSWLLSRQSPAQKRRKRRISCWRVNGSGSRAVTLQRAHWGASQSWRRPGKRAEEPGLFSPRQAEISPLTRKPSGPDAPDSTTHDHFGTVLAQYRHETGAVMRPFFTHMSRRMLYTTVSLYVGQLDAIGSGNAPIGCAASSMRADRSCKPSTPGRSTRPTSRKAMRLCSEGRVLATAAA